MKFHHSWIVIPVALALQAGVSAQSLADVAKAEEARRRTIKAGTKSTQTRTLAHACDESRSLPAGACHEHRREAGRPCSEAHGAEAGRSDQDTGVLEGARDNDSTVAFAQQTVAGCTAKPGERVECGIHEH